MTTTQKDLIVKDAEAKVEYAKAIRRLIANPDFITVIRDGFTVNECSRYVQSATNSTLSAEQRESALEMAKASGHFANWLSMQISLTQNAERDLKDIKKLADSDFQEDNSNQYELGE